MTYVRRAVESDRAEVVALCQRFHSESPVHSQLSFSAARVGVLFDNIVDNDGWLIVVACGDAGELVGLLVLYCMTSFFSDEDEVADLALYVTPDRRGTVAAAMLMEEGLAWYRMKGAARFQIGVTAGIGNERIAQFLTRFGLAQTGLLMQRTRGQEA